MTIIIITALVFAVYKCLIVFEVYIYKKLFSQYIFLKQPETLEF